MRKRSPIDPFPILYANGDGVISTPDAVVASVPDASFFEGEAESAGVSDFDGDAAEERGIAIAEETVRRANAYGPLLAFVRALAAEVDRDGGTLRRIRWNRIPNFRDVLSAAQAPDPDPAAPGVTSDREALDKIAAELDRREWDGDDLPRVASIVRETGRAIRDPD